MKPAALLAGLATMIAVSCAPSGLPPGFPVKQVGGLAVQVVDSNNDVGRTPSIAFDSQGHPVVAYQLLTQVPKAGVLPVPVVAGAAQPPSIMLATEAGGIWTRTPVTGSIGFGQKTQGKAPEIANSKFQAIPGVNTALAVDGSGKDHVAWATPSGLYYTDNASGSFGASFQITKTAAIGASIAVDTTGTSWISFYQGSAIEVATGSGTAWKTETVDGSAAPATVPALVTSIKVDSSGIPVVAYGTSSGTTVVAARTGGTWSTTQVTGPGGYGVWLALDKDGNPHLAYYDSSGNVQAADAIGGGVYRVTKIATVQPATSRLGPDASWGAGIGVDQKGDDFVTWADPGRHQLFLASNAGGSFEQQALPQSFGGANPGIAVSADGRQIAVAWYDAVNQNLDLATTAAGFALAFSPPPVSIPAAGPTGPACSPSGSTALKIVAPSGAFASGFDAKCLAVKPGVAFTVDFTNNDPGQVHNWALFAQDPASNPSAKQLGGGTVSQPVASGQSATYDVSAIKPGTYFFHCDFHPLTMTGTFVVAAK